MSKTGLIFKKLSSRCAVNTLCLLKRRRKCCVNSCGTVSKSYCEVKNRRERSVRQSTPPWVQSQAVSARTAPSDFQSSGCLRKGNWAPGNRGERETCFSERFIPFKFCANWLYIYLKDLRGKKKEKGKAPLVILMFTKIKNRCECGTAETTQEHKHVP